MKKLRNFYIIVFILSAIIGLRAINVTNNTALSAGATLLAFISLVGIVYCNENLKK